jgi:FkbM family methyltransferase
MIYRKFVDAITIILLILARAINGLYKNLKFGDFEITNFKKLLPINPVIIEVGANDGSTTQEFIRNFPGAKIMCFEPDKRALSQFHKRKFPPSVEIYGYAISDKDGWIDFFQSTKLDEEWSFSSSISAPVLHKTFYPAIKFKTVKQVQTKTLQTFTSEKKISHIDLLWLDTQGSERKVLEGMSQDLIENTEFIYLEFSLFKLYTDSSSLRKISKILKNHYILAIHQNDVLFAKL